ncbi:MAG TPA: RDD family protein [Gaiellaceae bacterium]|nr:RDD family protein [Gaiellaceae bacterium]
MRSLPGVGPRAAATVVDGVVGFVVVGIPVLVVFGKKSHTVGPNGGHGVRYSTSDPKVLVLWIVLAIAYYALFERLLGATPGKFVLGLRVRMADLTPLTWKAAVIRNVLRAVDAAPYAVPYLVAAIAVWSDGSSTRRIGDRVAGTVVTHRDVS